MTGKVRISRDGTPLTARDDVRLGLCVAAAALILIGIYLFVGQFEADKTYAAELAHFVRMIPFAH